MYPYAYKIDSSRYYICSCYWMISSESAIKVKFTAYLMTFVKAKSDGDAASQ